MFTAFLELEIEETSKIQYGRELEIYHWIVHVRCSFNVVCYPKMDQRVCLNFAKKDQLRAIVLMNRKLILKVLLKMVARAASLLT